jgi:hypothetical protein
MDSRICDLESVIKDVCNERMGFTRLFKDKLARLDEIQKAFTRLLDYAKKLEEIFSPLGLRVVDVDDDLLDLGDDEPYLNYSECRLEGNSQNYSLTIENVVVDGQPTGDMKFICEIDDEDNFPIVDEFDNFDKFVAFLKRKLRPRKKAAS